MIKEIVAKRYARSLISIGQEDGLSRQYGDELDRFEGLLHSISDLKEVLENPIYNIKDQKAVLNEICKRMNFSPIVTNFLNLLLDKRRMSYFLEINSQYRRLINEISGITTASVLSAVDLPEEYVDKLKKRFGEITKKEVVLHVEVDPSLIGGLVAKIGDMVYDGSIRTQLYIIKETLGKGEV